MSTSFACQRVQAATAVNSLYEKRQYEKGEKTVIHERDTMHVVTVNMYILQGALPASSWGSEEETFVPCNQDEL